MIQKIEYDNLFVHVFFSLERLVNDIEITCSAAQDWYSRTEGGWTRM